MIQKHSNKGGGEGMFKNEQERFFFFNTIMWVFWGFIWILGQATMLGPCSRHATLDN